MFIDSRATPKELQHLCHQMINMGAVQAPLFLAAQNNEIDLLLRSRNVQCWPTEAMSRCIRPTVVLVGDDPAPGEGESVGPKRLKFSEQLRAWQPCSVMIHAAAGEVEHYRLCVFAAQTAGQVAMIETASRFVFEWRDAIDCPNTLILLPDGPHPIQRAGGVH